MASRASFEPRQDGVVAQKPTPALIAAAGSAASKLARIWPRPHQGYFALEPPRRRLAALIAQQLNEASPSLAEPLATWSLKRLANDYAPGAPAGLVEALRKLDPAEAISPSRVWALLAQGGEGAKTIRHAAVIDHRLLGVLEALPDALRRPRIVALLPCASHAGLASQAARMASKGIPMDQLADRLERARSAASLFRMLVDAIGLERLAPPPIPGADWLRPVANQEAIRAIALRFQNCLVGRIPALLAGEATYYEVLGEEPAVVEIVRDASGLWVVGEIRGHANCMVSNGLRQQICAHLAEHGAGRGRPSTLAVRLAQAAW